MTTMTEMFKSDTFKMGLVLALTLGAQIVGLVHWVDMATPNWVGALLMQMVLNIVAAFGISLTLPGKQP